MDLVGEQGECKYIRRLCCLFLYAFTLSLFANLEAYSSFVQTGVMEVVGSAKSILTPEGEVEVENIVFSVDEDMNQRGAVTVYLVVCYDRVLFNALRGDSADQFKRRVDDYINDYTDKIVILKWNICAKKYLSEKVYIGRHYVKSDMAPVGGFIFVTYSTPGVHRYVIPSSWKDILIHLTKAKCELRQIT